MVAAVHPSCALPRLRSCCRERHRRRRASWQTTLRGRRYISQRTARDVSYLEVHGGLHEGRRARVLRLSVSASEPQKGATARVASSRGSSAARVPSQRCEKQTAKNTCSTTSLTKGDDDDAMTEGTAVFDEPHSRVSQRTQLAYDALKGRASVFVVLNATVNSPRRTNEPAAPREAARGGRLYLGRVCFLAQKLTSCLDRRRTE